MQEAPNVGHIYKQCKWHPIQYNIRCKASFETIQNMQVDCWRLQTQGDYVITRKEWMFNYAGRLSSIYTRVDPAQTKIYIIKIVKP